MAKKPKPYMVIETKEEFDKIFKDIYNSGHQQGYHDGIASCLSTFLDTVLDYDGETLEEASAILAKRKRVEAIARANKKKEENHD